MIRILIGFFFWLTNTNDELAKSRLKVCAKCEKRKWFVCGVCGCSLNMKARLIDESCPHPQGSKW